jgi:hypothetical protein
VAVPAFVPQLLPAVGSALVAGWAAWAIPFFPSGWAIGLAALAAGITFFRPRAGVALALAVPIFPLGNFSLGAAVLYVLVALALFAVSWRDPRSALFFALGPVLAPIAALGFLPLSGLAIRSPVRRGVQVAAAVLAAGLVAGVRGAPLPFAGAHAPKLPVAASGDPGAVLSAVWHVLVARPALGVEALVLAAVAVLLPAARARGLWGVAALGAAFLAAALLLVPAVAAAPLVVAVWATCAAISVR